MVNKIKNLCTIGFLCMFAFTYSCDQGPDPESLWESSGHADTTAEAFIHWDEDDPQEVPTSCAKCHSTPGFLDFVGADGTAEGTVDNPAEIGTVITCEVCHADKESGTPRNITSVTFPSGLMVGDLSYEAICMQCHQGRESKVSVDEAITEIALESEDTVSEELGFKNIHYYAAAATLYGTLAKGGYEYDGKLYDAKLNHIESNDTCIECHDPHSLKLKIEECSTCHTSVASVDDLYDVRFYGSLNVDYDGDGDVSEGIYYEITGVQEKLYAAIQDYAKSTSGTAIAYDAHTYPYFFIDSDGDGEASEEEAQYGNQYNAFTPRLLKAAYNYQLSKKDPGAYAHGGKYVIQLLYDSIENLGAAVDDLTRNDEAHFDGSIEAWRHWDEDDPQEVEASCAKCHANGGLAYFLENGENVAGDISNGLACSTCHDDLTTYTLREAGAVTFPSGLTADMGDNSNLCLNCHQGRESKSTVDVEIAASEGPYGFKNIHYIASAAVLYGTDTKGGYEYDGKTYEGLEMFSAHGGKFDTCVECHMGSQGEESDVAHNVHKPTQADCVMCHGFDTPQPNPGSDPDNFKFSGIRKSTTDFDVDGDTSEKLGAEKEGLEEALLAQIQTYAKNTLSSPIVYDDHSYPYFFKDTDGDGEVDEDEASYGNKYEFDATLLKAAFNYQFSKKEPHAYIHNMLYVAQLMVDSIADIGGDVSAYTWR